MNYCCAVRDFKEKLASAPICDVKALEMARGDYFSPDVEGGTNKDKAGHACQANTDETQEIKYCSGFFFFIGSHEPEGAPNLSNTQVASGLTTTTQAKKNGMLPVTQNPAILAEKDQRCYGRVRDADTALSILWLCRPWFCTVFAWWVGTVDGRRA